MKKIVKIIVATASLVFGSLYAIGCSSSVETAEQVTADVVETQAEDSSRSVFTHGIGDRNSPISSGEERCHSGNRGGRDNGRKGRASR